VVELIRGLQAPRVAENLRAVRGEIDAAKRAAGRPASDDVRILAAVKYVPSEELGVLAEAGVELVGENRAQDLGEKASAHGELFEWHFIGQLQSRRVRLIVPYVSLIHSVASRSALAELRRHDERTRPGLRILLEVNVAGEHGKAGIAPEELDSYIEESPLPVAGLMTMPPLSADPEDSRRWFSALRDLAAERDLHELSMGTSQDYLVAAQEGATIVRIGTRLYD
jgi:pyridoxal phosphate enzyme (YggS family)